MESEYHVMFVCNKYNDLRDDWLNKLLIPNDFSTLPIKDKFKLVLHDPLNVRPTAKFLVSVMDLRRLLNKAY